MRKVLPVAIAILTFSTLATGEKMSWDSVQSWVYQLCNYTDGRLDEIAKSDFDLAVIDLTRDGGEDYFTASEISMVKDSGKIVLAYFEIGAIEDYRPEWKDVPEDIKAGGVDHWPKEQYVKFWDERWWPVVKGRVDQALKSGFDGAYLDMVTTYEEIPNSGLESEVRAQMMVKLIVRISQYAKGKTPDFKIVPQNCPELYTWSFWGSEPNTMYIEAIDGIGLESVFYIAHDIPANMDWCQVNRDNALAIRNAGKLVLGVDYAKKSASIVDAYNKERAIGFIPYASVEELDRIQKKNESDNSGVIDAE